ncbi:bifunctional riboflavin kinase/FAD synthetase [Dinghuibacter silviterrae]|uniref:Riboflavin biosynthesis protein n=1 Tax=Dinghuibacter silviterrae TaxID=1539049 RepID=A0A4R8DVY8_9BACT|nr:bifunctional riboflavin kinase/FAD synthetase [Dinghuibacter silviterrae]TDX01645.1 riboflavin kinase/FMN adenylyltransferase [Dinghuibacter silviterrae]
MQVHSALDLLPGFRNAVITIGTFDGVHKGHQEIIASMKAVARETGGETVILTFHPHPRQVVRSSDERIALLSTLSEKIGLLDAQGIDHLVVIPFTREFSQLSAEDYIEQFLVRYFQPHTIIIGYDHRFGNNRSGDFRLLEAKGPVYGFRVREIPERVLDLLKVSSTRIREALLSGRPELAADLLGYPYFFEGRVVLGQQLGRTLGFPTANIEVEDEEKLIPAHGVYAVRVDAGLTGMMNIGIRPTVGGTRRVIEVHLLDYQGDLYGKTLRIHLAAYLRPEQRFNGLDALKTQLQKDKEDTYKLFHNATHD